MRIGGTLVVVAWVTACSCSSNPAPPAATPGPAPVPADAGAPLAIAPIDAAPAAPPDAAVEPPTPQVQVVVSTTSDRDRRSDRPALLARPWCEGKSGDGAGESITIELTAPTALWGVSLSAGLPDGASTAPDPRVNRPTEVTLSVDGAAAEVAQVDPDEGTVAWAFEPARTVQRLTFAIGAVRKGKQRDSCLRDLELGGAEVMTFPAEALASSAAVAEAAVAAFVSCDRAALAAVASFPYRWRYSDEGYEPEKVSTFKDTRALARACKGIPEQIRADLPDSAGAPRLLGDAVEVGVASDFLVLELRWTGRAWMLVSSHLDLK